MSHRASGSTYHRLLACAYWARLDVPVVERPPGDAAVIGNEAHAILDQYVKAASPGGRAISMALAAAWSGDKSRRIADQAIEWLRTVGLPTHSELALIYNAETDTARMVEPPTPRDYGPIGPMEIPTTLDLVWFQNGELILKDFKTGSKSHTHEEQLRLQALAASRYFGVRSVDVGWLWGRMTKCEAEPVAQLEEDDLDAESWRASSALRRLPVAQPSAGNHCFFCPARPGCPAHQAPTETERLESMTT